MMDTLLLDCGLLVLGLPVAETRYELGSHRLVIGRMRTVDGRENGTDEKLA